MLPITLSVLIFFVENEGWTYFSKTVSASKTEFTFLTAREQLEGLGTIGVRHNDECHAIYLTIRLRARVFYERIVNEAQPTSLSLVENEGE